MISTFDIGFGIKFDTNLGQHIKWVEWMSSSAFPQEILRRWEQSGHLKRLVQLGRSVIREQIYSVSKGAGKIEESVTAKMVRAANDDIKSIGGATVFLDPNISGATGPVEGMDESKLSYAAFFEKPEFNSFLLGKGADVLNPIKHRPFFDEWTIAFFELEEREHLRSLLSAIKSKLPRHSTGTD